MKVVSVRRSAAACFRRAGAAVRKFFGPFEPARTVRPARPNERVVAPFHVSYGRVVFCLYYPRTPQSGSDAQGRLPGQLARWIWTRVASSMTPLLRSLKNSTALPPG